MDGGNEWRFFRIGSRDASLIGKSNSSPTKLDDVWKASNRRGVVHNETNWNSSSERELGLRIGSVLLNGEQAREYRIISVENFRSWSVSVWQLRTCKRFRIKHDD